jgi:hypothetical protein
MRKAIVENGVVTNMIEYTGGRLHLAEGQLLVDCGQFPVAIGDDCVDWRFYRDGVPLVAEPTEEQQIAALEEQLTQAQLALAELAELYAGGAE